MARLLLREARTAGLGECMAALTLPCSTERICLSTEEVEAVAGKPAVQTDWFIEVACEPSKNEEQMRRLAYATPRAGRGIQSKNGEKWERFGEAGRMRPSSQRLWRMEIHK